MEVWVAETWHAHGEGCCVHGVYASREAAFEDLKKLPNMTVYVNEHGNVVGRPKREWDWSQRWSELFPGDGTIRLPPAEKWAMARPMQVQARLDSSP